MIKDYIQFLIEDIKFRKIYILFIWFSFFLSINLNPSEFENFNLVSKIRLLLPLILIFISILVIKINYKALIRLETIIFIVFIISYFIFNLFNNENPKTNFFWPVYMFLVLFFIVAIVKNTEIKFLFKTTIFIIFVAFSVYFSLATFQLTQYEGTIHFYGVMGSDQSYFGIKNPPRSSGIARLSLVIFTFLYLYFLINYKDKKNKLFLSFIGFFALTTIVPQSRTVSFIFLSINFLIIFFYYKEIIKNKIIILFVLIAPLAINFSYDLFQKVNYKNEEKIIVNFKKLTSKDVLRSAKNSVLRQQNYDNLNNYTSGRLENWKTTLNKIKTNPIKGYGSQADRIYINQSMHNAFLYSWLSGGILGAVFILGCYLKGLNFFVKFFLSKNLRKNLFYSASLFILIIIYMRSLLETSFAIYSIDYLIFIVSIYYLKYSVKE